MTAEEEQRKNTEPDYLRMEHIGEEVLIENKKTKTVMLGRIIDETRDTYLIETVRENKKVEKRVVKKDNNFIFIRYKVKIDGSRLNKRPEDRIKIKKK